MEKVYIAKIGRALTVPEYVLHFGAKRDANGLRTRPPAHCRICKTGMHTVNENLSGRVQTWAHNPSTKWCALKDSAKVPYELLQPDEADPIIGAQLRTSFLLNWVKHWMFIRGIVARCDIGLFVDFVRNADRTNFWSHVGLEEWNLPYIFLSLYEFPPPKKVTSALGQPTWIRCYFDARVRGMRDLWIETDGRWDFFIVDYNVPKRGCPGPRHLISERQLKIDSGFLSRPAATPHPFAVGLMKKEFPGEVP